MPVTIAEDLYRKQGGLCKEQAGTYGKQEALYRKQEELRKKAEDRRKKHERKRKKRVREGREVPNAQWSSQQADGHERTWKKRINNASYLRYVQHLLASRASLRNANIQQRPG